MNILTFRLSIFFFFLLAWILNRYRRLSIKIKWGLLCRFGLPWEVPLWRDHGRLFQSETHQNPRPHSPVHRRAVSSSPNKIQVGREGMKASKQWNFCLALLFLMMALILMNTHGRDSPLYKDRLEAIWLHLSGPRYDSRS